MAENKLADLSTDFAVRILELTESGSYVIAQAMKWRFL